MERKKRNLCPCKVYLGNSLLVHLGIYLGAVLFFQSIRFSFISSGTGLEPIEEITMHCPGGRYEQENLTTGYIGISIVTQVSLCESGLCSASWPCSISAKAVGQKLPPIM
jgi:hypothetical protein